MRISRETASDLLARATVATLMGFLSYNLLADFMRTGHLTGLLLLVSESMVVVFTIARRRARLADRSLDGAIVTVVSVAGPPFCGPQTPWAFCRMW
jgi:hypothetical protein